jgi:hypothetical protein
LKNELRLRIGPQRCEASIWRAGVQTRCAGRTQVRSRDDVAIDQALSALVADGHALPGAASVCVEDEFLYYTTLPAGGAWNDAHAAARDYFAELVDDENIFVETSLAPCGHNWLAVAINAGLVDGWRDALAGRDIELRHVRAALFEDLWTLRPDLPMDDGVAVMMRREGATIIGLQAGRINNIAWERCEVDDPAALVARVHGYCARLPQRDSAAVAHEPAVFIVPADVAQQASITPLAAQLGWRVITSALQAQA